MNRKLLCFVACALAFILCLSSCAVPAVDPAPETKSDATDVQPETKSDADEPCAHTYGDWQTVTEADCLTDGLQTRSCTKCGEKQEEIIPALGHSPVTDEAFAPTDTVSGQTEGTHCERCGLIIIQQENIPSRLDYIAAYVGCVMNTLDTFFTDTASLSLTQGQVVDLYGYCNNVSSVMLLFNFNNDGSVSVDEDTLPDGVTFENTETPLLRYTVSYAEWSKWMKDFIGKEVNLTEGEILGTDFNAVYNAEAGTVTYTFYAYGGTGGAPWHPSFQADGSYGGSDNVFDFVGNYYTDVEPQNASAYDKITMEDFDYSTEQTTYIDVWVIPVTMRVTYDNGVFHLISLTATK